MSAHVFVDESKARGYLLAAAVVMPEDLALMRRQVGALCLPRQRRIHFHTESDTRRKTILSVMAAARAARVLVYDASGRRDDKQARDAAMTRLVDDVAKLGAGRLVIERDDSAVAADRKIIRERAERAGCQETLLYEHLRPYEECLLAIPDAVAWCWRKGGVWRQRAQPLVWDVVYV